MRKNPLVYWHAPVEIQGMMNEVKTTKRTLDKKERIRKKYPTIIEDLDKYSDRMKKWNTLHFTDSKDCFKRPRALLYNTMLDFNKKRL